MSLATGMILVGFLALCINLALMGISIVLREIRDELRKSAK